MYGVRSFLAELHKSDARHFSFFALCPLQRFVLLTNSRQLDNEYPMNQDEMLMSIDAMQTEASPLTFNNLYDNLQMIMKRNSFKSASLFVYSDFQENMMNMEGMSGNFGGRIKGAKYRFVLQDGTWDFS